MNKLKPIIALLVLTFFSFGVFAQTNSKDVSITSSGSGKTLEDAKQAALRSSTEQAFGAFISSKTEMFNDQVVADQMASVSSGNIKSYEVLNESQLPDGSWGVTLKTILSVDKLTSFVEAKGIAVEIKGGLFAFNIKQQLLNEQGEVKAICEMVGLLHEPMQISFDYTIKSGEPKSVDAESKNWEIPLVVTATTNKNIDFCANYCIKTLAALSLSSEEKTSYQSLNKAVFPVVINYNGVTKAFYLRKQISINALNTLASQWAFYTRLFTVQSGMDESYGNGAAVQLHEFSSKDHESTINFLTTGQKASTFSYKDKRTLTQIEQMTGYTVKPRGVYLQFKHGGFVVYEPFEGGYRIGLDIDISKGNIISYLTKDFPAALSGLKIGDKILSINNNTFVDMNQLRNIVGNGEIISIKLLRNEEVLEFRITPIYIQPYKGLVAAITDLGEMDWNTAKTACDELILNGYSDWHLPSKEELKSVYVNLGQYGVGGFANNYYWSSTEYNGNRDAWKQFFSNGYQTDDRQGYEFNVRAVRAF